MLQRYVLLLLLWRSSSANLTTYTADNGLFFCYYGDLVRSQMGCSTVVQVICLSLRIYAAKHVFVLLLGRCKSENICCKKIATRIITWITWTSAWGCLHFQSVYDNFRILILIIYLGSRTFFSPEAVGWLLLIISLSWERKFPPPPRLILKR